MKARVTLFALFVSLNLVIGCGKGTSDDPAPTPNNTEPNGPNPNNPKPQKPDNPLELSFENISKRVFAVSCNQCHHRANNTMKGELGLDTYAEVKDNAASIYIETIIARRMPLESLLTKEQFDLLKQWLEVGAPELPLEQSFEEPLDF